MSFSQAKIIQYNILFRCFTELLVMSFTQLLSHYEYCLCVHATHCTKTTEAYLRAPASTPTPTGIYNVAIISEIDAALHHIKGVEGVQKKKQNKFSLAFFFSCGNIGRTERQES